MMKTDDYNDQSVTEEKLKDGAITTRKIADGSVTKDKLDSSIRQEINDSVTASNEATEKAKEATAKADQATENAKQATAAATAAKEAADTATQLATNATTASAQATEQAKAATTKAEESAAKANEAAQRADDSREQTEQTLGTMQEVVDKVAIKDEEGTLVETPFRYIQNEEFIFAKVDAEDKLLFGIQWDGTPKFGKTSAVEDRLQSQVTLLAERVATIMGDEDTTNVIDTMNELKKFFAEIENTETLTGILANLDNVAKNLDKTTIKDEEGNVQDTPFRVIENEKFIMAVVDSDDRVLFGIYRATGKPYYPLNEMYHVEQNEEYFALWLDAANHVLLGIRRDNGEIIGEIHAVNALKQVISQIQTDVSDFTEINLEGKKISILGDSLSTFANYIPSGNATYYPNGDNDVTSVEQTWWMKLISKTNSILEVNNSFSGSRISGNDDSAYTNRIINLGSPDYIIINGGTNDFWGNVPAGSLHFDLDDSKLNVDEFADSYDLLIRKCKSLYQYVNIILVIPHVVSQEYTDLIKEIAKHYCLFAVVDLHKYSFTLASNHYQDTDMTIVANAIYKELFVNKNILKVSGKGLVDANVADSLSSIDNPEFLAVEQDAEGKILSTTNPDGSHYIYNVKSETIENKVDKEEGKSLINSDVAESHTAIEDIEGRTEITTDSDNKILGYRDSEGTRHEHKISAEHLKLSNEAATEVSEAFKSAGIKMENPSDFSKNSHIELPIPRIAAQVRLYAPKLPTTKQDDIEAEIEYNDKDGNYFSKLVILNAQGSSSMNYYVKNMAIDINDGSEIKFGDFPTQDSFHLKKYYIDAFRGQCIVGYWLMEQVYKSRPLGQQYPYEYSYSNESTTDGLGDVKKDFFTGAKCHPDGFPINITWISNDGTETDMGIYTWNLKKSKEVYYANKKKAENIILDGEIATDTLFGGTINWSSFEIRNPKSLIDINGNKYDGDNPTELSDTDPNSKKVKDYLVSLSKSFSELNASKTKDVFEKHFLVNPFIDYCLVSDILFHIDGFRKNWIWLTYNGMQFTPSLYDVDSIFGSHYAGIFIYKNSDTAKGIPYNTFPCNVLYELYKEEIENRYKYLRDSGVFTEENILNLLTRWTNTVGYDNYKKEYGLFAETPSYRRSTLNSDYWEVVNTTNSPSNFSSSVNYGIGDSCILNNVQYKCIKECVGESPALFTYKNYPYQMGYFNSVTRVKNWLSNKIVNLDIFYNYK